MSYWGNFARTGYESTSTKYRTHTDNSKFKTLLFICRSPNGNGLVNWPKYGAEEKYMSLDLKEQVLGQSLKKDRFIFATKTLPEKISKLQENVEHREL